MIGTHMIGERLGSYQVRELIGTGAMGEVYLATDTRLRREVALKVLRRELATDPVRLQRLDVEARALASLNHPGIAAIHGVEESDGLLALVLEFVAGRTLEERLRSGPIPLEEALALAAQLTAALEEAHAHGIVHRDLKPANIKVRPDGVVKVLDFGIAKVLRPAAIASGEEATVAATRDGEILGTVAYMAPEQLRGQPVDARADIWAFGCVLYEMLTGRSPFLAGSLSDTIAHIIDSPPDWGALPGRTPPGVRRLLRRCLRKDHGRRLRHIGDAGLEIAEVAVAEDEPGGRSAPWGTAAALVLALVAATWAAVERWGTAGEPPAGVPPATLDLTLTTPAPLNVEAIEPRLSSLLALAPDGSRLVYVARNGDSSLLYEHRLDGSAPRPIEGTDGGRSPFFSPDGTSIGFIAGGRVHTLTPSSTVARSVGPATSRSTGVWMDNGDLIATHELRLVRYTASGSVSEVVTPDAEASGFEWPFLLPDGEHLLVATRPDHMTRLDDPAEVRAVSLRDGRAEVLAARGSTPAFLPAAPGADRGYLLYALEGTIWAAPLALDGLRLLGPAVAVVSGVMMRPNGDAAQYAVADSGTLVYLEDGGSSELGWVDGSGQWTRASEHLRSYAMPRLSPDERRVALEVHEGIHSIWVLDLERDTLGRMSYEEGGAHNFAWGPDSRTMLFTAVAPGKPAAVAWKRIDEPGEATIVASDDARALWLDSWSRDGRIAGVSTDLNDVWLLPLTADTPPRQSGELIPVAVSEFQERDAMVTPDGDCVAYSSNETGSWQIFVRCLDTGERIQVSAAGGREPVWSRSGDTVYFRSERRLMAAPVARVPELRADPPANLHEGAFLEFDPADFDVTAAGDRFLRVRAATGSLAEHRIHIRFGWQRELERLVAGAPGR